MSRKNKKHVIIIGASDLVLPAYRIAREELGLGTIAFDYNSEALGMKCADVAVCVSTKDVPAAVIAAEKLRSEYNITGVFTAGADAEITVAAVAEALSLPGIPLDVAKRCNDKLAMHRHLDSVGFTEKPRYRLVHNVEEALEAVNAIGLPCILKPLDNCASRGVQRIEHVGEVEGAYALATSFNGNRGTNILVEECLEGTKHTVEIMAWEDRWHLLSIIDTHYISPRWPCETGLNTTIKSTAMQNLMFKFAERVARLVGINFNAHKVDVNVAADGTVKLIELTARLSGGFHCQYASPLAFGSNDIRAALRLSVGEPLNMDDIRHRFERGAAVRAVFPKPGRIVSISGLEDAKSAKGVAEVFVWRKVGDMVGPYLNSADRPAFVIAGGETTDEAVTLAELGRDMIRIETLSA